MGSGSALLRLAKWQSPTIMGRKITYEIEERLDPVIQVINGIVTKVKARATTAFLESHKTARAKMPMGTAARGTKAISAPMAVAAPRPPLNWR